MLKLGTKLKMVLPMMTNKYQVSCVSLKNLKHSRVPLGVHYGTP